MQYRSEVWLRGQDSARRGWALTPLCMQDYLLKIIDTPGLLKPEQVSALFGNIENIYALNRYGVGLTCIPFCLSLIPSPGEEVWMSLVLWAVTCGPRARSLRVVKGGPSLYKGIVSSLQGRGHVGPCALGPMCFLSGREIT